MIIVRELTKSFGSLHVLEGINLEISDGQCLVILGRSGTGKSVLLKLICGLIKPDSGSIQLDGVEINGLPYGELANLRKRMGMLFQMAALFDSMTVGENVGLALREHTPMGKGEIRQVVAEKLALVGLEGIEDKKPADLSGGMRKRVGLARAIAMDPAYVLYDEPTTGLDPITAQQINILIRQLQEKLKITSVVVTHDLKSASYVGDRLCLLHEGEIRFDGTPDEMESSEDPIVQQFVSGDPGDELERAIPGRGTRTPALGWSKSRSR
jgi:phospholipid/cholesterol/gamma-HCH transport system ATP-binding protein